MVPEPGLVSGRSADAAEFASVSVCLWKTDGLGRSDLKSKAGAKVDLYAETIEPGKLEKNIAGYGSKKERKWSEERRPGWYTRDRFTGGLPGNCNK